VIEHVHDLTRFKVVDLTFVYGQDQDGETIFAALETLLPDRLLEDQLIGPGWNSRTREFTVTVFEGGLEYRAGIARCIRDLGFDATETLTWI
jgi:hypothetical protein